MSRKAGVGNINRTDASKETPSGVSTPTPARWVQYWRISVRSMNPEADRGLMQYFADRQAWLLRPDWQPVRLVPYGASVPEQVLLQSGISNAS